MRQHRSEWEDFSLPNEMRKCHARKGCGAPAPGNLAKITLLRYLSMELHKGDLQLVLSAEPPKYATINFHHHQPPPPGTTTWFKVMVHPMGKSFGLREWLQRKVFRFFTWFKMIAIWHGLLSLAQEGFTRRSDQLMLI